MYSIICGQETLESQDGVIYKLKKRLICGNAKMDIPSRAEVLGDLTRET